MISSFRSGVTKIFALLVCTQRSLVVTDVSEQHIGPIIEDRTDRLFQNVGKYHSTLRGIPEKRIYMSDSNDSLSAVFRITHIYSKRSYTIIIMLDVS